MALGTSFKMMLSRAAQYEFWPYLLFYAPLYPYGLYLAWKARSFTYFTAANPIINNSGVIRSSKYDILRRIAPQYVPETMFFSASADYLDVVQALAGSGISYPFIIKPDIGERGDGVEKIHNLEELQAYLSDHEVDFMIQTYIDSELELGISYYRYPNETQGHINSIVIKGFLTLQGDGQSTILQLITNHLRAKNRVAYFTSKLGSRIYEVLRAGEQLIIEPIGNHKRGTTFLNGNHLITEKLERIFDEIANINGFYYGRFDVRVPSVADLYAGQNIQVMELNGVSSEPGHIYDPEYQLKAAYRDLREHFDIVYNISLQNHAQGIAYKPLKAVLSDLAIHYYPQMEAADGSLQLNAVFSKSAR